MNDVANDHVLAKAELDRLAEWLATVSGGKGMNLEEADGYFAALPQLQELPRGDLSAAHQRTATATV